MNPILNRPLLIVGLLIIFVFPAPEGRTEENKSPVPMAIKGKKITVEVARTDQEKEKGLMFREKLGPDEGMLFVYEREEMLSFWMKNTRIPLSIAFINHKGKIVDIQDMEPFSLTSHVSRRAAQYALEMNKGWFQRNGVHVGDSVTIPEPDKKSKAKE